MNILKTKRPVIRRSSTRTTNVVATGVGSCVEHAKKTIVLYSLGSNECKDDCSNYYLFLAPVFAAMGLLLVAFIA